MTLGFDNRYAIVYNVRNDEGSQVPGVRQNVRGAAQDGAVLLGRVPAAGFPYQEAQKVTLSEVRSHFLNDHGGIPIGRSDKELLLLHRREHRTKRGWGVWAKPHAHKGK